MGANVEVRQAGRQAGQTRVAMGLPPAPRWYLEPPLPARGQGSLCQMWPGRSV